MAADIQKAGFLSCVFIVSIFLGTHAGRANAHPLLDGATIANSGSTNAAGWTITLRSDGRGSVAGSSSSELQAGTQRSFSVDPSLAQRFLAAARAARGANAAGRPCVKSVSFGTRLTVTYHGWTSPDLSCPPASALLATLSADVSLIENAAHPPSGSRIIHVPMQPRRAPPTPSPL